MKIAVRILLLPIAFLLHLIPHIIGLSVTLYKWVRYGGEFIVYDPTDRASIGRIWEELKKRA